MRVETFRIFHHHNSKISKIPQQEIDSETSHKKKSSMQATVMPSSSSAPGTSASNNPGLGLRPSKSWGMFRIETLSHGNFVTMLANFYERTAVPNPDVTSCDLKQVLPAIFESLCPSNSPNILHHSEFGVQFTTFVVNDNPCFNLISVDAVVHPVDSWWGSFMANQTPYRHRPEANNFLSLGMNWGFSEDLWAAIFEKCRNSGVPWWALATTNAERCLFGVFDHDWKNLVTAPVAFTHGDALRGLAYWADCAYHSESPSPTHLPRPGGLPYAKDYFPRDSDEPLPPPRIARLLEEATKDSPAARLTRARTVARKAFMTYDEKTGEPVVVRLATSHVEGMRMKSAWMRTGDEVASNRGDRDGSSVVETIYGVTEEQGYNDPDMAMDLDPSPDSSVDSSASSGPSPSSSQPNLQARARVTPGATVLKEGETKPNRYLTDPLYLDYCYRLEHLYKWHREHFSPHDDLDRADSFMYLM
ncbi:hypothetical protein FRC04_001473 [Tulasnella sp. 424]|nr:hypothetical protein FRC04_001473 [Tulasnella sp. 424]KAG8974531.1 hypothetical protein FRC05_007163 [Tulasnella sp. 425]